MLSPDQFVEGVYPLTYENQDLAGMTYIAVASMNDKTSRITVNNNYARETSNWLKLPVVWEDPDNLGASILRYLRKLSPGQTRMYCQAASPSHRRKLTFEGHRDAMFFANKPCGVNSIRQLFREGAKLLGLEEGFRPHSLRGACITKMVNSPDVSLAECMSVARHNSASASKNYQRVDGISEGNRLRALRVKLPPRSGGKDLKAPKQDSPSVKRSSGEEPWPSAKKLKAAADGEDSPPPASMTQVDIACLKEELSELKGLMEDEDGQKMPALSPNQVVIKELREEVMALKEKLKCRDQEEDLYVESVTQELSQEVRTLKRYLEKEKEKTEELRMENSELARLVSRRFGNSHLRSKY